MVLNVYWYHPNSYESATQQEGPLRYPSEAGQEYWPYVAYDETETTAPLERAVTVSPENNESGLMG